MIAMLLVVVALPLTVLIAQKNQDNRQRASEGTSDIMACTFDEWVPAPDWLLGNSTVGTFKRSHADGYWDEEKQEDIEPGPVINAGDEVATTSYKYNLNENFWKIRNGAKLPVKYDPWNDVLKGEFSGRSFSESNWSRFLRVMNDAAYMPEITSKQISTGVLMKYKIMGFVRGSVDYLVDPNGGSTESPGTSETQSRANFAKFLRGDDLRVEATAGTYNNRPSLAKTSVKGEKITLELISRLIGFEVTVWKDELYKVGGSVEEQKAFMIAETAACPVKPTAQPTSTVPVSCEEQLMVPPVGFKNDFPPYTSNHCAAHIANHDPVTNRDELDVCGDYWVSGWCNNPGNSGSSQRNAIYACRGWSQTGSGAIDNKNRFMLYYSNRIQTMTTSKGTEGDGGQLAANIAKYGDVRGRRITWNNLMQELKEGSIAYPWEHSSASKTDEVVRNNALQAASSAIFGKPWGAIKEQERINNCPTTWDNPITPPVTVTQPITITPSQEENGKTYFDLTLLLHGIGSAGDSKNPLGNSGSNKDPKHTTRSIALHVMSSANEQLHTDLGTVTYSVTDGTFKGTIGVDTNSLVDGSYLKVKSDQYLVKKLTLPTIKKNDTNTISPVSLVTGDIDGNNELNILDYNILADCYSDINAAPRSCSDENKVLADLTDDGKVNQFDYNLFIRELPVGQGE